MVWPVLLALALAGLAPGDTGSPPADWTVGDVFVASGNSYQVWHSANPANPSQNPYAPLPQLITDGLAGQMTGCAFDSAYRFFGTNFTKSIVDQYSIDFPAYVTNGLPTGVAGQFITGASTSSTGNESIVFDRQGNFFVGHAIGGKSLEQWSRPLGSGSYQLAHSWTPQVENTGVDWIDLASNGTTIYYTSEGRKIFTFDTQSGPGIFADLGQPGLPNYTLFALRLLTDGSGDVLVADKKNIKRVRAGGTVVKTYDASGQDNWQVLSLDSNGTSFWAGDASTHKFYRFNIGTGAVEAGPYSTGANTIGGICVHGGFSAAQPAATTLGTQVLSQSANTITLPTLSGATFTASLVGLGPASAVTVTVRESLVQPSVGQSDPVVFSFNPGNPGNPGSPNPQIGGNMPCDQTLTNLSPNQLYHGLCEVFEFEANPNSGFTTTNLQILPNASETTPNLRLLRNLDEDVTDGVINYPLSGTKSKCVFTVNSQTLGFNSSQVLCGGGFLAPIKGQGFTKNSTSSITFKFQALAPAGNCGSGPFLTDQGPDALRPLLMVTQLVANAAPNSIPVIVAGKSGGPPVFTFTGNTWQLQVKTTDMPAGFTYLATVIDLNNVLSSFSTTFSLN